MSALWSRWVAWCAEEGDPLPLALVRVMMPLVMVWDLLEAGRLGLVTLLWRRGAMGGISRIASERSFVDDLSPEWGGPVTWGIAVISLSSVSLGVATRPMMVIGLLAYAQLGHLFPPGDRAIDRLMRTVLLVLIFSRAHERLSLGRWLRGLAPPRRIPIWPERFLRFLLVLVYLGAASAKLGARTSWFALEGTPVLYRILTNPRSATLDPVFWVDHPWIFRFLGIGTVLIEVLAVLILTRWRAVWAIPGAAMHLGIAVTMRLGIFSWGMLSLYPLLWGDWIVRRLQRSPPLAPNDAPAPDPQP